MLYNFISYSIHVAHINKTILYVFVWAYVDTCECSHQMVPNILVL